MSKEDNNFVKKDLKNISTKQMMYKDAKAECEALAKRELTETTKKQVE